MKKYFLSISFIGLMLPAIAQQTQGTGSISNSAPLSNSHSWATTAQMNELRSIVDKQSFSRENSYANIAGSPFLTEEKVRGFITLNDGKIVQNVPIQYDLYAQAILVENKLGEEITLDNRFYKEVNMKGKNQTWVFKKINPNNKDQFYQILFEGHGMVLAKEIQAILKEGRDQGIAAIEPEFFRKINYYILQKEHLFSKVSLKKNKLDQFYDALPAELTAKARLYSKQHKLKLKKERDFVELLNKI